MPELEPIATTIKPSLRSRTYAPALALGPYIARHYVFSAQAGDSFELVDHLLAETAFARFLLGGEWHAEAAPDVWSNDGPAVFFGPNSRPLRVRVRGPFRVVGMAFRPAGWRALSDLPVSLHTDRMVPLGAIWGERAAAMLRDVAAVHSDDDAGDAATVAAMEAHVRALLDARGWIEPDLAMQRFEGIAGMQSTTLVRDAAARIGLGKRSFERRCLACFGMGPKAVLRRSRFLDMAAAMRGLSDLGEHPLAALRYYDQPQLIREFRHFIGMTPGQFAKARTLLLDAGLELREQRKLADSPGA